MKKKIFIGLGIVVLVAAIGAAVVLSGVLVRPTEAALKSYKAVESYQILDYQFQREQEILKDYRSGKYTLQNPYVIQDPYQANPLSAFVIFETEQPALTQVMVVGKDANTTFIHQYQQPKTHHEIAVLGLYAGANNKVRINVQSSGKPDQSVELTIKTEALPFDFPKLDVAVSKPEAMEAGVTLMIACFETSYTYMLDARGEVRGYFSNKFFGHGTAMRVLSNGRLLATGDVMKLMPYNMYTLWEMNLMGKVYVEYEVPNAVHHEVIELSDGDFLATSNNKNAPFSHSTREDVIVRIDRESGMVSEEIDLGKILDGSRSPYHHFDTGVLNQPNQDWAHLNSVEVDLRDGGMIASSPIQSTLVKFDPKSNEIRWILSSPEGWDGEYSRFQKYLLKPVGEKMFEWSWGQHSAKILAGIDSNPETIDLLVFDNGQSRSFRKETSVAPEKNYSRAVIYRINEAKMTVEQLWQYGKQLGASAYATFLGSADYQETTGNILIDFGGMMRKDGIPVDTIIDGVLGKQQVESRVVEVRANGEVVFDIHVTPNNTTAAETYQARRIALYNASIETGLDEVRGQLKGEAQASPIVEMKLPNFFVDKFDFDFNQIFEKDDNLILHGNFTFEGKTYLIGRLNFVLMSGSKTYVFQASPSLNGNIYARISLKNLEPGEYAIYAVGGVIEGNDAKGSIMPGYNPTGYKIVVK